MEQREDFKTTSQLSYVPFQMFVDPPEAIGCSSMSLRSSGPSQRQVDGMEDRRS